MREQPANVKILIAVFNYDGWIRGEIADWYFEKAVSSLTAMGGVEAVTFTTKFRGYPVTRLRNKACAAALSGGYDYLLMIDNDNIPDCRLGKDPRAKPFFPDALEFARKQGPCVVGAPYCATPPKENCIVMKWDPLADPDLMLEATMTKFSRLEAATLTGFQEVAALPTGMLLIDLRVLDELPPPWFQYEYTSDRELDLAATEDVYFTRNLSWVGVKQFVFWDAWAGHMKEKMVDRPEVPNVQEVPLPVRQAWARQAGLQQG